MTTAPKQARPVHRPHFVAPHRTVDVVHGTADQLIAMRMRLMHGANYNDPQHLAFAPYARMQVSGRIAC
jgi:cyanobactin biosynthesis protein (PatB/AcyB/McaB family)